MTTKQVETATVVGTVTLTGNATVTVTAFGMTNSPKAISVAVTDTDTASIVGGLIRTALAFDADVAALFIVSGTGADVVLTRHVAAANDTTLNIAIANGTCTGLTAAPTSTNTTAGTGLTNGYATLAQLKASDVLNFAATTAHDEILEIIIEAVSRTIDDETARQFYQTTEARYFDTEDPYCLEVDDIDTTSGITIETDLNGDGVYEYTWSSTDYYLADYNNRSKGYPYSKIITTPQGLYTFSKQRKGNKVTAPFGWASIPKKIVMACLQYSNRTYKRFDTALGIAGASAVGAVTLSIPEFDADTLKMLWSFRELT
jgi:hypothetical protein